MTRPSFTTVLAMLALIAHGVLAGEEAAVMAGAAVQKVPSEADKNCVSDGVWPNPCGSACLRFAMAHFGVETPPQAGTDASDSGTDHVARIQAACREAGLSARQIQLDTGSLGRLLMDHPSLCAILALNKGHFAYVDAARDGQFRLTTLSGETRWCQADTLAPLWPGLAVVISKDPLPLDLVQAVAEEVAAGGPQPLRVVFFHSPTCHECQKVKSCLPQVTARWGSRVSVELHSIEEIRAFEDLLKYEKHYGATVAAPPAIFVGNQALVGDEVIVKRLDDAIAEALAKGTATFCPIPSDKTAVPQSAMVPSAILRRFESLGPGAVAIAGLVDGVNPCAFTTIVFFLSMLAYLKKTRRQMLAVGVGFTVGMFAAYFLLGLGLLGAVKTFSVSHGLSSGLACGVAVLAFALAGWSLIDAVRYIRTGDTKQVTLGLPRKVKERIHRVIRTGLTTRGLVIGSVSVGFVVSVLESLCTGQVYLPTIVFMTRAPGMRAAALGYLLLYNTMFIVPLVAILAVTYLGVRSDAMGNFFRRRLAVVKCGMAVLFACLGFLVMATL